MSDKEHIRKLKENSAISFRYLYDKYSGLIFYISSQMGCSKEASEEIVQDTFLKIWEKRLDLDQDFSFKSYIVAIARNLVLKSMRKKMYEIAYQKYSENFLSISSTETEDEILFGDLLNNADKIIDQLPEVQKKIFLLNKQQHLPANKIAEKLNLSQRTVENQLYRANKKILTLLKDQKLITLLIAATQLAVITSFFI